MSFEDFIDEYALVVKRTAVHQPVARQSIITLRTKTVVELFGDVCYNREYEKDASDAPIN